AKPIPPVGELTLEEQRSIIAFAHRLHRIPMARAYELAMVIAERVLPPDATRDPVAGVAGVAAWLLGVRPQAEGSTNAPPPDTPKRWGAA
ncbi:MAG: hypothetical protein AAF658_03075, partial [Myxococcota bacterium]